MMSRKNNFKIIVTLGPSILNEDKLKKIDSEYNCIYRINGAHVDEEQAERLVSQVRNILPKAHIMLCLPGNKIRTANLSEPIRLIKGESFILHNYEINYPHFSNYLKKGDIVLSNDSIFTFEVVNVKKTFIKFLSHSDGLLLSNKGLNIRKEYKNVPFLFDKDRRLIDVVQSSGIDHLALSFVRTADDIREVKGLLKDTNINIIAKIETFAATQNLKTIFDEVGSVLIDRGDLSTEVGILKLAMFQDRIVDSALKAGKDVYLATHFLKNMETKPVPLISEIIDLTKTLRMGISGIQLSEETAIGKYPIECIKLIFDVLKTKDEGDKI